MCCHHVTVIEVDAFASSWHSNLLGATTTNVSKSLSLSLSFPLCCIYHLLTCLFHLSLQFRAKLYKLQHPGKELVFSDMKPPVAESEQQGRCGEMNKKGREAVGEGEIRIIFKVLTTIILFCVSRSDGYEHCHSTEGRK